ncbi:hypothetical protein ABT282_08770 [Streptomyces sp. NPDC000927]|uniref:hypothetical protein n=1 Tax=Streptomyces sp. NPDC000927 TaxID=3154371 RepID=UPI003325AEE9
MNPSFRRLYDRGATIRYESFQVSGVPEILITDGIDKGKSFIPNLVTVTYTWCDATTIEEKRKHSRWDAGVFGRRVLANGKLGDEQGMELGILYEMKMLSDLPCPAWLLDLIRKYGPNGWTYTD